MPPDPPAAAVPPVRPGDLTEGNIDATDDPDWYLDQADEWGKPAEPTPFTASPETITDRGRALNRLQTDYDRTLEQLLADTATADAHRDVGQIGLRRRRDSRGVEANRGRVSLGGGLASGAASQRMRDQRFASELAQAQFDLAHDARRNSLAAELENEVSAYGFAREDIIRDFERLVMDEELAYLTGGIV